MRKILNVCLFALLIFSACSSDKSNRLPPLEIDVPAELAENKEAVQIIESGTKMINKSTEVIEDLFEKCEPYLGKTEEELSTFDKIKLTKTAMEFSLQMGSFMQEFGELEQSITAIAQNGLDEKQTQAIDQVMEIYKKRMNELGEKYKNLDKQND